MPLALYHPRRQVAMQQMAGLFVGLDEGPHQLMTRDISCGGGMLNSIAFFTYLLSVQHADSITFFTLT